MQTFLLEVSMTNYLKILSTYYGGHNIQQVATICGCTWKTANATVTLAKQQGLSDAQSLAAHTEESIAQLLHPELYLRNREDGYEMPDYEAIHLELAKPHVTLKLLWEEYVEHCLDRQTRYYAETQFRKYYHDYAKNQNITIRLKHKPGYSMQVDWAGTKIVIYDEEQGADIHASLFVAVLPYSKLIYAEPCRDESAMHWLRAHVNAFHYLNGVPRVLVPDNLKTGVTEADFYSPTVQRQYDELAGYYGAVILPARVRKPRDKGLVENAVLITSRRIIAKLRNLQMMNFEELQINVRSLLDQINDAQLSGKELSRRQIYQAEEYLYMQKLPDHPYEYAEWKSNLRVAPDAHVSFQKKHYSVPHEYVGKIVEIRATATIIEVFHQHERIASHRRSFGTEKYITDPQHIPPDKLFFVSWDRERFLTWGSQCGPSTARVIQAILDRSIVEEQGYRACHGIRKLADDYGEMQVEAASRLAFQHSKEPTYRMLKQFISSSQTVQREHATGKSQARGFQRGSSYFGGGSHDE